MGLKVIIHWPRNFAPIICPPGVVRPHVVDEVGGHSECDAALGARVGGRRAEGRHGHARRLRQEGRVRQQVGREQRREHRKLGGHFRTQSYQTRFSKSYTYIVLHVCVKFLFFLFPRLPLCRYRNKVPAPFRHPVDVFSVLRQIVARKSVAWKIVAEKLSPVKLSPRKIAAAKNCRRFTTLDT
jgi:hypothetical protein